jgi:phosphoglucosamine mutase
MKRLFGTDGIRGLAGRAPLDPAGVRRFGAALACVLTEQTDAAPLRVVLGRDTRESGPWLRDAVADGMATAGAVTTDAGVISTPGLAYVLLDAGFDAGVMISASHNPFQDNGLKAFGRDGTKLSDELEKRVEDLILDESRPEPPADAGTADSDAGLLQSYTRHLRQLVRPGDRFQGLRIVLDCANGAAFEIAPEVFRGYGAQVICQGVSPNGKNINLDCGSMHLDALARRVRTENCDLGLAFDGDADRVLAVDRRGRIVDGDHILYLAARRLKRRGELRGDAVVATIMSNLWLEQRLLKDGIELHRAPVGDKYVLKRMLDEDLVLGGEQSGHIIFREHATTGDGILCGLLLIDTLVEDEQSLEEILDGIEPCPQIMHNVRVREKPDLRKHPTIGPAVAGVERALADRGRVVLRYSGTEPVARVMVEGVDEKLVREHAEHLAETIREELGEG